MDRPGNEFPKRLEILECGPVRIVKMRGRVVQVGGDPQRIADAGVLDERQELGEFDAAAVRPGIGIDRRRY